MLLKQNTARNKLVFMTQTSDHVTGLTGATLTITSSQDGGDFGSITPTVTERGSGWYSLALTTAHTNTLGDLALHITATSADPTDVRWQVVSALPGESNIRKNTALSAFEFVMTDSATHAPITGRTVTATVSLDGAAFAACANSVSEVASGVYKINLAAADTNGNVVTLMFTAAGSDPTLVTLITQP